MKSLRVFVPWSFFGSLLPYSGTLLNGNALLVRACGNKPTDGSVLQSQSFVLFGNGIATLVTQIPELVKTPMFREGCIMEFVQKRDRRQVEYWEAQSVPDQQLGGSKWRLGISTSEPKRDDGEHVIILAGQSGRPGQFIYLDCAV